MWGIWPQLNTAYFLSIFTQINSKYCLRIIVQNRICLTEQSDHTRSVGGSKLSLKWKEAEVKVIYVSISLVANLILRNFFSEKVIYFFNLKILKYQYILEIYTEEKWFIYVSKDFLINFLRDYNLKKKLILFLKCYHYL